jgi:hypothetical protein
MALKAVVDSIDAVPAALREFYTEKDGKYHLPIEGMVPKDRVDEFRNTNITLQQQIAEISKKFDGIDPAIARELLAEREKQRGKKLIDEGKIEELLNERVETMRKTLQAETVAERQRREAAEARLSEAMIDGAIRTEAVKAGVRPAAVDDVLFRGQRVFKLQDGKAMAMNGDKPIFGASGEPLTVSDWIADLQKSATHLFEPSSGAGARGSSAAPGAKTMTRAQFDALSPMEKATVIKTIKVVD